MRVLMTGNSGPLITYERLVAAMQGAEVVLGLDPLISVQKMDSRADHFAARYANEHGLLRDFYPLQVREGSFREWRHKRNRAMLAEAEAAVILHDPGQDSDIDELVKCAKAAGIPLWLG